MNLNKLFHFLVLAVALVALPELVTASTSSKMDGTFPAFLTSGAVDSIGRVESPPQDDKDDKKSGRKKDRKKGDEKPDDVKRPDIKQVPKAKRKIKPVAVKTKVKIPVKRVKPVIKKPLGLIRKNLVL